MAITKISTSFINGAGTWTPVKNALLKINEAIDVINGITAGTSDGTFDTINVTGLVDSAATITTASIGVLEVEDFTVDAVEAGSFTMNKTGVVQTGTITSTVIANRQSFSVTTVSSTLATNTSATFTVTNSTVSATSIIVLSASTAGAGIPVASVASVGSGTFNIKLYNAGSASFDNTIVITAWVVV